jgi:hypothetical protein
VVSENRGWILDSTSGSQLMSITTDAGSQSVHFGRKPALEPKMAPVHLHHRNKIHIVNFETLPLKTPGEVRAPTLRSTAPT